MGSKEGLILWILGGLGTLLLYAAYKNELPQSVLLRQLGQSKTVSPIVSAPTAKPDSLLGTVFSGAGIDITAALPAGYANSPATYKGSGIQDV